ncbi:hypothetical protein HCN44_004642 [Aphidius gifuensis]|uniref:Exocyst complex component Sec8 n=1 Tax=Aphidius gifuensis TaxID=684658 RepID=A0A834XZY1_APHGI|nr:exocyst complex component 4 [Aphidius gifuensis]KAF7995170.1 hypothetical protein HCN44_004642 [Aphidius gifuensis]
MSIAPPMKPPRGIKTAKETSGLLISVIRTLSASETNEQREIEKAKLEKEYKKSDQRLDELVSLHYQDLTQVMNIFSYLSERVTVSREKIHAVKENLNACKQLLSCRREELMKLWLEGIEHKHVLYLLNEIDRLKNIPSQLNYYLNKKLYLHATQLIVSAQSIGNGSLEEVEALREVKNELDTHKQQLQNKLFNELNKHLYIETSNEVFQLKKQGSSRDFQRSNETRGSRDNKLKRSALLDVNYSSKALNDNAIMKKNLTNMIIEEDEKLINPEENSEYFISIVIECLALLNNIPETVEKIKNQMENELFNIIDKTTDKILNEKINKHENTKEQTILIEFFDKIFDQFRLIANAHNIALKYLSNTCKKYNININLYEIIDVWNKIQFVLQNLISNYLDIQDIIDRPYEISTNLDNPTIDINGFFTKRKQQRQKNGLLFKFESSTHSYSKDQRNNIKDYEKKLIYEANPKNITIIFRPIMKFVNEIECQINIKCTLNTFISDYVKEVFLGRHHVMVATKIDTITKSPDAWKTITTQETMKELNLSRPLLQSTIKVDNLVGELRLLMIYLPLHSEHFCTLALNILHNYRETCHAEYRKIIQTESQDKKICSAAWLKDDDISRFIKSLPNWNNMKNHTYGKNNNSNKWSRQETQDEESPEEIRQRNLREAEILASTLGEGGINSNEILSDVGKLRCLALLQESIEWFSLSIITFTTELNNVKLNSNNDTLPNVSESLIESLEQVAIEFEELSNTCILVLHLEVRVQCFYYLLPRGEYSHICGGIKDPQEADPRVEELSKILQTIDEALQCTMHPKKSKYIFEGLGHLIAKILITSAQYIEKIDKSGIQRMCRNVFTLQQTLTNITMARELALDYARQYFELFYNTPDDILNNILENGPQFSELEYINAFQLISRSQQQYSSINKHLEKLSEILGEVGVTV